MAGNLKIFLIAMFFLCGVLFPQKKNTDVIYYGGNNDFYPFEFIDDEGKPAGFIIDLLNELQKETNLVFKIELRTWNKIISNLSEGKKYNLTALYYSTERDVFLDYCTPLLITYDDIFIRKDEKEITSINALKNKKVLVERGGFIEQYIKNNLPQYYLVPVEGESEALKLVNNGSYDAAIVNYYSGIANINRFKLDNIYSKSIPFVPREYGFAVINGDEKLLAEVNSALANIKQRGAYDTIYKKWFFYDNTFEKYYDYFLAAGIIISILVMAALLFLLWNRTLKNEVEKKTFLLSEELEKRKVIEKELIAAKEESEKLSRFKSEFISQISHEIRTPVNSIIKGFELLKDEGLIEDKPSARSLLDSIQSGTKRLIRTIDLIVNFSEVNLGVYKPHKKTVNLEKDVIDLLIKEFYTEIKGKGLEIIKEVKTKNCEIESDEYSVIQVFANILDNAVKFTDKGTVKIIIERNKGNLAIKIQDTGKGISPEYFPMMFTPFSQEQQGYSRSHDGNGLGLSLANNYCKLNNAKILVDSELGKGSTFTVVFY